MSTTNTTTFLFDSRESYLVWRADWKTDYRELSEDIRRLKRKIAQTFKEGGYAGEDQNTLRDRQHQAILMLGRLKEAKLEAQRQYLAERAAKQAA